MAYDLSEVQEFTDVEMVKWLRRCLADAAFAQRYAEGGVEMVRDADSILEALKIYEPRAAIQSGGTSRLTPLLARFGNPR